ncbi:MAG TPA: IS21 family transposase, partial [Phenylobacterium sp.]
DAVLAGIRAALAAGAVSADVVAIEARKASPTTTLSSSPAPPPRRSPTALVTLQARTLAQAISPDSRPAPSVAGYDELLTRRTRQDAS